MPNEKNKLKEILENPPYIADRTTGADPTDKRTNRIDIPAWQEQIREAIMELLPKDFFADKGNQLYVDGYIDCHNEIAKAINQFCEGGEDE